MPAPGDKEADCFACSDKMTGLLWWKYKDQWLPYVSCKLYKLRVTQWGFNMLHSMNHWIKCIYCCYWEDSGSWLGFKQVTYVFTSIYEGEAGSWYMEHGLLSTYRTLHWCVYGSRSYHCILWPDLAAIVDYDKMLQYHKEKGIRGCTIRTR